MTPDDLDELADATADKIVDNYADSYTHGIACAPAIIRAALAKAVAAERARCVSVLTRLGEKQGTQLVMHEAIRELKELRCEPPAK